MVRLLIAAILGGALMFGWGGLAHEVLPLGSMGISMLPPASDASVLAGLKSGVPASGLYFVPTVANWPDSTKADMDAAQAKARTDGWNLLVHTAPGDFDAMTANQFLTEAIFDVVCALIIGVVLLHVPASVGYLRRVGVATLIGLYGSLDIDASYHNWYGFPASYFHAQVLMAAGGALCAGLVVAALCKQEQT